jgi:hypothetical protein
MVRKTMSDMDYGRVQDNNDEGSSNNQMAKILKCKNKIPNSLPPQASLVHYHMVPNLSHVNSRCLHPAYSGLVVCSSYACTNVGVGSPR